MNLTLLIPCKNDKNNLTKVITDIKKIYPNIEILVVTNNINDFDFSLIEKFNNIRQINQNKPGYGSALKTGIDNIHTKFFIIHNADGSFEVEIIQKMYDLSHQFNFVFCDRYIKNGGSYDDTILTFIGNKIFSKLSQYLLNIKLNDVLYTHVLCNTEITKSFVLKRSDFTFCVELPYKVFKFNNSAISLPTVEKKRISGKKNVNEFKDGFLILLYILKLFFLNFQKR
tara:strand:- start:113 stop:793 length:681 start_codon:yes stop_codon:yes gene_type:complete